MQKIAKIADRVVSKIASIDDVDKRQSAYFAKVVNAVMHGEIDVLEIQDLEDDLAKKGYDFTDTLGKLSSIVSSIPEEDKFVWVGDTER